MEKICTRCNFRNPAKRAVCQVCGYAKFRATTNVPPVAATQLPVHINDRGALPSFSLKTLVQRAKAAVFSTYETCTSVIKHRCAILVSAGASRDVESKDPVRAATRPTAATDIPDFVEGEDLDSMIAWFKSYGIDRPLILESTKDCLTERREAA